MMTLDDPSSFWFSLLSFLELPSTTLFKAEIEGIKYSFRGKYIINSKLHFLSYWPCNFRNLIDRWYGSGN